MVPLRLDAMLDELGCYCTWYNDYRPHQALGGRTPSEVSSPMGTHHSARFWASRVVERQAATWSCLSPCPDRDGDGVCLAEDNCDFIGNS